VRPAFRTGLDLIFALRPLLWIPAIALFAAGESWGHASSGASGTSGTWGTSGPAALGALLLLLGAVHVANGWRDRAGDRLNRKGAAMTSGAVSGSALAIVAGLCLAGSLLLSLHPTVGGTSRALLAAAALLGAAYVAPGVELKRRAGLDLLCHGIGYGVVAFLLGASAAGAVGTRAFDWVRAVAASAPYAAGILAVALVTMIADAPGDASSGQRTLAVRLGDARAWTFARGLAWATLLAGLQAHEWVPALWGLLAAAVLSLQDSEGSPAPGAPDGGAPDGGAPGAANRCAILLQAIFIVLLAPRAPWMAVAAVGIAAASSAYGAWRWGEAYPWNRLAARKGRRARGPSEEVSARRACT